MKKIISVLALVVSFASAAFAGLAFSESLEEVTFSGPSASIYEANSNFDLNSLNTENVNQQIVVANWGTKDMTEVVASELGSLRNRMDFMVDQQSMSSSLLSVAVLLLGVITLLTAMNNFQTRKSSVRSTKLENSSDTTKVDAASE